MNYGNEVNLAVFLGFTRWQDAVLYLPKDVKRKVTKKRGPDRKAFREAYAVSIKFKKALDKGEMSIPLVSARTYFDETPFSRVYAHVYDKYHEWAPALAEVAQAIEVEPDILKITEVDAKTLTALDCAIAETLVVFLKDPVDYPTFIALISEVRSLYNEYRHTKHGDIPG